jgi:hypothetical protein
MNFMDADRKFLSPDDVITGKSVVREANREDADPAERTLANPWPYMLTDYLRNFTGKTVRAKYVLTDSESDEIRGRLIVVGSNFIGLQPDSTENLLIIELSALRSVEVDRFRDVP